MDSIKQIAVITMTYDYKRKLNWLRITTGILLCSYSTAMSQTAPFNRPAAPEKTTSRQVLSSEQWRQLDQAVDRGLHFLSTKQRNDGSFEGPPNGQIGITGLCVLAYLSGGHLPSVGRYGQNLSRSVNYVLSSQQEDGLLYKLPIAPKFHEYGPPNYNHAIAGLMLTEVYGMTPPQQNDVIEEAIRKAIKYSCIQQNKFKRHTAEKGGWRYSQPHGSTGSDLSVTTWQLVFLRSAKNAGFEVPEEVIIAAVDYVKRSFDRRRNTFVYALYGPGRGMATRAMAGSGIVALAMAGEHDSDLLIPAADWLLSQPFDQYNDRRHPADRYHYSAYYASQAMFQVGGDYWRQFFPKLMEILVMNQREDGSWDREAVSDGRYGNVYTTALSVLALTPQNQIVPIFQR